MENENNQTRSSNPAPSVPQTNPTLQTQSNKKSFLPFILIVLGIFGEVITIDFLASNLTEIIYFINSSLPYLLKMIIAIISLLQIFLGIAMLLRNGLNTRLRKFAYILIATTFLYCLAIPVLVLMKFSPLIQEGLKPSPTPSPIATLTPTPGPTAEWKTYTNPKYGFSLTYPIDIEFSASELNPSFLGVDMSTEKLDFNRNYLDSKKTYQRAADNEHFFSLEIAGKSTNAPPECSTYNQNNKIKIDGHPGVFSEKSFIQGGGPGYSKFICIENGQYTYLFLTQYSANSPKESQQAVIRLFDQILSTFKFTDSNTLTPTCIKRPACLDATPRCMIAEPANGWCP